MDSSGAKEQETQDTHTRVPSLGAKAKGMVMVNVLPSPSTLATAMLPCIISANCLDMKCPWHTRTHTHTQREREREGGRERERAQEREASRWTHILHTHTPTHPHTHTSSLVYPHIEGGREKS